MRPACASSTARAWPIPEEEPVRTTLLPARSARHNKMPSIPIYINLAQNYYFSDHFSQTEERLSNRMLCESLTQPYDQRDCQIRCSQTRN